MKISGINSRCKRDALPTELSARAAELRSFTGFFGWVKPWLRGTKGNLAEWIGTRSPEIVPKPVRALIRRFGLTPGQAVAVALVFVLTAIGALALAWAFRLINRRRAAPWA